jgi:hypothetical protein
MFLYILEKVIADKEIDKNNSIIIEIRRLNKVINQYNYQYKGKERS